MAYSKTGKDFLIYAQSDQTIVSQTTPQDDNELLFEYKQNVLYEVELMVTFNVANVVNGGLAYLCTATNLPQYSPRSRHFSMEDFGIAVQIPAGTGPFVTVTETSELAAVFDDIAVDYSYYGRGFFLDDVGDGTFQFQFAQDTSVAAPGGIIRVGDGVKSWIRIREFHPASESL